MGHNCNLLPTHPAIREALRRALEEEAYRHYAPTFGLTELRELVVRDLGLPGCTAIITNGGIEALYVALRTLLRPGDDFVTTDPTWPHTPYFGRDLGAHVIEIPIYDRAGGFKLTPEALRRYLTPRTRAIGLLDPLNPVGCAYTPEEVRALCAVAAEAGAALLHDCTYRDFADVHLPAPAVYPKALATTSLSKWAGFSGLRLGAVVGPPDLMEEAARRHVGRLGANLVAQHAAIAALRTKPEWFPELFATQRRHQGLLRDVAAAVPGVVPLVFPSQTNFVAFDVTGAGIDANALAQELRAHKISIRSGSYGSPRFGERFFRVGSTVPLDHVTAFAAAFPKAVEVLRPARVR
jgi:aspartate/methionine/tyrosine aminotransferase